MKVKKWNMFQHYKNRRPPWIRLYRDLLDDPEFHALSGDQAKSLVLLWLIASEDETKEGELPSVKKLAFRLRMSESKMLNIINGLTHWVDTSDSNPPADRSQYASNTLASSLQDAIPESESEGEGDTESESDIYIDRSTKKASRAAEFETFYSAYPKKVGRGAAEKAWEKAAKNGLPPIGDILKAIEAQRKSKQWSDDQFIPHQAIRSRQELRGAVG
jgi:hypothetical protein